MARSLRDLRRKMKAIKSTRQVTKAMELVAASKMRRAVENAQTLRRYAITAGEIIEDMAEANAGAHPYLTQRPARNMLAVVFTSDRGLCGSLNAQVLRTVSQYVQVTKDLPGVQSIDFIAVGRKGQQFLARTGQKVIGAFPAYSNHPRFKDILPVTRMALEAFVSGQYDRVTLIYPDFKSALLQQPTAKVLLPFSKDQLKSTIEGLAYAKEPEKQAKDVVRSSNAEFLFEPSQKEILDVILPQLTEVQVYHAVLEAAASEHSARMVAMRNASDNASDLLDDLTLTYNQTRQANITGELSEISAATAAMK